MYISPPSTPWLVAVSGGGDSMALLHRLVESSWTSTHLTVAHFNHNWSPWGAEAEAFVRATCTRLNLPLVVGQGAGKAASNAEAHARTARYTFFQHTVQAHGLAGVITAHTQTDVLETFLMRLGKGSGLTGLTSMQQAVSQAHGVAVWRPLLGVSRAALRTYLTTQGHTWLEDPADVACTNQRARLRVAMPQLAELGLTEEGLIGCLTNLTRAEETLAAQTDALWGTLCLSEMQGTLSLSRTGLLAQPEELAHRILSRALNALAPGQTVPRTSKRLALLARIRADAIGKATLGPVAVQWNDHTLSLFS